MITGFIICVSVTIDLLCSTEFLFWAQYDQYIVGQNVGGMIFCGRF